MGNVLEHLTGLLIRTRLVVRTLGCWPLPCLCTTGLKKLQQSQGKICSGWKLIHVKCRIWVPVKDLQIGNLNWIIHSYGSKNLGGLGCPLFDVSFPLCFDVAGFSTLKANTGGEWCSEGWKKVLKNGSSIRPIKETRAYSHQKSSIQNVSHDDESAEEKFVRAWSLNLVWLEALPAKSLKSRRVPSGILSGIFFPSLG